MGGIKQILTGSVFGLGGAVEYNNLLNAGESSVDSIAGEGGL